METPLIITWIPRSGTTSLHSLLIEDRAEHRAPRLANYLSLSYQTGTNNEAPLIAGDSRSLGN